MSEPLLKIENLAKRFGGIVATDGRMISLIALDAILPPSEEQAA